MEANITDQQSWGAHSGLSEPHFDEKATLLSAQPVVPIGRLSARPRFSRKWLFGFALIGMLFLGISATSVYYSRLATAESQPAPEPDSTSTGLQGFAAGLVAPVERAKEPLPKTPEENSRADSDRSGLAKPAARTISSTKSSGTPPNTNSKKDRRNIVNSQQDFEDEKRFDYEDQIRAERRAARRAAWEERRPRRYNKRSDRGGRIRDPFEFPPRP